MLCGYSPSIGNQQRFVHLHFETHVVALNTRKSAELLHHFLERQGYDVVPNLFED